MFIKNAWYVACTPAEIAERPLGRTVCGEKMAFFRDEEGQVAAVEDFCPHRGAPLSLGFVEDGKLVCGYHGLAMAKDGRTDSMPNQRVRAFPCVKRYAVVERYGFIWVWPGDAEQAREEDLHHCEWADSPDWAYGGGLYHIQCGYQLMIDNLMDLTHETYVHATSIGQPEIDEAAPDTTVSGDQVVTARYMENIQAPPFWQAGLKHNGLDPNALVDRWQVCRFSPPSHVMIDVGVALAGKGGIEADLANRASSRVIDFITPETETSHWYFWGMARQFRVNDDALTDTIREGQGKIFAEDLEMLERQQQNLLDYPDRNLLKLNIDAGGVQARKIVDRLLAAEAAAQRQGG